MRRTVSNLEDAKTAIRRAKDNIKHNDSKFISEAIMADIMDRRGIKNSFESVDDHILEEIKETWACIIDLVLYPPEKDSDE